MGFQFEGTYCILICKICLKKPFRWIELWAWSGLLVMCWNKMRLIGMDREREYLKRMKEY